MGRLPGNKFENVYLTSVMDTISYLFTYFVIEKTNRRIFMASTFALASACCLSGSFLVQFPKWSNLIRWCAFVSKFGICGLYSAVFLVAAELFPTPVRSTATAIGMAICTIGGFISPLLISSPTFTGTSSESLVKKILPSIGEIIF